MASKKKQKAEPRLLDAGQVVGIALDRLVVSPHNVRKTDINDIEPLAASIKEHGLLQPLVGYEVEGELCVFICAGQRRLLALEQLVRNGDLPDGESVPVRLVEEVSAIEVSLAENLERKAMNPADEVKAFKALVDTGTHDATTIARRFGYDVRFVKRRLKMATLIDPILEALQQGKITVDAAEAYAAGDADTQLRVFKAHSKPNAWHAHSPSAIVRDISGEGIDANGRLAKFIGGVKAYRAAGGTEIGEEFGDLFTDASSRLRDMSIVNQLYAEKQAKLEAKMLKAARETYPFVTGVVWQQPHNGYLSTPAPEKKSGLTSVSPGWDNNSGKYLESSDITKRAKKAVEKEGATCLAVITLDADGKPELVKSTFHIGKDAWSKTAPKKQAPERTSYMTPEEQEAQRREREITGWMGRLYGRSIVGETPGFGVTRGYQSYDGRIYIELQADTAPTGEEFAALLEPFREAATTRYEELIATEKQREEARKQELEAADAEQQELINASHERFEELATTPCEEWPFRVWLRIDVNDEEFTIEIERGEQELIVTPPDGDSWSGDTVEVYEILSDSIGDGSFILTEQEEPDAEELSAAEAEQGIEQTPPDEAEELDPDRLRDDALERKRLEEEQPLADNDETAELEAAE